jgi:hypothetical protein
MSSIQILLGMKRRSWKILVFNTSCLNFKGVRCDSPALLILVLVVNTRRLTFKGVKRDSAALLILVLVVNTRRLTFKGVKRDSAALLILSNLIIFWFDNIKNPVTARLCEGICKDLLPINKQFTNGEMLCLEGRTSFWCAVSNCLSYCR